MICHFIHRSVVVCSFHQIEIDVVVREIDLSSKVIPLASYSTRLVGFIVSL